ncbi:MAG TPA: hypothetical protein ENK85_12230 [Saprospiraceae bacterium]|nr:hypothetical protein [Saprospiraceae bacterium]
MKWLPYIAIWIYGIMVAGFGLASIYNPVNAASVAGGRIPTDIFTIVGIIIIYFAYASTKQYFHAEAREKKRFDILMISVLNIVLMLVPIIFLFLFTKNMIGNIEEFSHEAGFYKTLFGIGAILIVAVASYFFSLKMFLYNK